MNELPHDPNSLADELDRVLPPGQSKQATSSNDPLVDAAARLSAAPRPVLSPQALARIHATMLAGQSAAPSASRSLTRRYLRQSAPVRLAVAAILVFVFVTGAVFAARIAVQLLHPPIATTTLLPATATGISTDTPTPPPPTPTFRRPATELPLIISTIQPTTPVPAAIPTMSPTASLPTAIVTTALVASTAEPTLPVTLVVEGPIQSINGATIVIFDLTIVVSSTDPILTTLQVGDIVRVEGNYATDAQVIMAVHITVIRNTPLPEVGAEVNPTNGQVWTDPGDCSNPPPPWAPAKGWRRRCQGGASPGNSGGNGMGMGD